MKTLITILAIIAGTTAIAEPTGWEPKVAGHSLGDTCSVEAGFSERQTTFTNPNRNYIRDVERGHLSGDYFYISSFDKAGKAEVACRYYNDEVYSVAVVISSEQASVHSIVASITAKTGTTPMNYDLYGSKGALWLTPDYDLTVRTLHKNAGVLIHLQKNVVEDFTTQRKRLNDLGWAKAYAIFADRSSNIFE